MQYRLAPQWPWPAQIIDTKCAIRYLRASAAFLHIDPSRIGVMGWSAGGQLAAMAGLAGPNAGFDVGQYVDQSSRVQAVVDEYGPADLAAPGWLSSPIAPQVDPTVFGVTPGSDTAALAAASPAPPTWARAHRLSSSSRGPEDSIVVPPQSVIELVDRLTAAHDEARLIMVQGAGHGFKQAGSSPIKPDIVTLTSDVASFFLAELAQPG